MRRERAASFPAVFPNDFENGGRMHMAQRYNYGSYVSDTQSRMNYRGTTPPASAQPGTTMPAHHEQRPDCRWCVLIVPRCFRSQYPGPVTRFFFSLSRGFTPPGVVADLIDAKIDAGASYASRRKTHNGRYAWTGWVRSLWKYFLKYLITMITIIIIIIILLLALLHT